MIDSNKDNKIDTKDLSFKTSTYPLRCSIYDSKPPTPLTSPWRSNGMTISNGFNKEHIHNRYHRTWNWAYDPWDERWNHIEEIKVYRKIQWWSTWTNIKNFSSNNYTNSSDIAAYKSLYSFLRGRYNWWKIEVTKDQNNTIHRHFSIWNDLLKISVINYTGKIINHFYYTEGEIKFVYDNRKNKYKLAGDTWKFIQENTPGIDTWYNESYNKLWYFAIDGGDSKFRKITIKTIKNYVDNNGKKIGTPIVSYQKFDSVSDFNTWFKAPPFIVNSFYTEWKLRIGASKNEVYSFVIDRYDNAWNRTISTINNGLKIDNTIPTLRVTSSTHSFNTWSNKDTVKFKMDVTTGGPSDVNSYYCYATKSSCSLNSNKKTSKIPTQNPDRNITEKLKDGKYTFRFRIQDVWGKSLTYKYIVKIDASLPTINAVYRNPKGKNISSDVKAGKMFLEPITVILTCKDTLSGCDMDSIPIWWSVDKKNNSISRTFSSDKASHSIYMSDKAGNKGKIVLPTLKIDSTPPQGIVNYKKKDRTHYTPGTWSNQNVSVHIKCSDAWSGCGAAPSGWTKLWDTYTRVFTSNITSAQSVNISDLAWNVSSVNYGPIQIDAIPPTVKVVYTQENGAPYIPGTPTSQNVTISFICNDAWSGCDIWKNPWPIRVTTSTSWGTYTFYDIAWNSVNVIYSSVTIYGIGGIKITGNTSSQGSSDSINNALWNEVRVLWKVSKTSLRKDLEKNIYQMVQPFMSENIVWVVSDYSSRTWQAWNGGKKILGNTVLYFNGDSSASIQLDGGVLEWKKTIIVNEGNIYIRGNITKLHSDDLLGIIALNGNIFIHPDVTDIHAVLYAKKSIMSSQDWVSGIEAKSRWWLLKNQLYIKWSIFSENTLGGSDMSPVKCPFYVTTCTPLSAPKYDFNYLRWFYVTTDWDGKTVISGNRATGAGSWDFPIVVDYDPAMQLSPPPLFWN